MVIAHGCGVRAALPHLPCVTAALQEYTNFYFDVQPDALHGALDRFAQFFVAPLFVQGAMEREVQAVNSEFAGVLQSDHSRLSQLMCHTVSLTVRIVS